VQNSGIWTRRDTSLIRERHLVGPYTRTMPRLLWRCWGEGGRFRMSEVTLYTVQGVGS
jgi:hypothetical protein